MGQRRRSGLFDRPGTRHAGVTTAWHALAGVVERYVVVAGRGRVEVGGLPPTEVGPGETVFIPADVPQRITNVGGDDLVFSCVCSPRFTAACYRDLESGPGHP